MKTKAKNVEKNFFKLMNNSVFGKMIGNARKRRDVKLIVTNERRKKLVSEPNYVSSKPFSNYLVAIKMRKTSVGQAIGQAILDESKEFMYKFYYDLNQSIMIK